jgi:hypothetical protein
MIGDNPAEFLGVLAFIQLKSFLADGHVVV